MFLLLIVIFVSSLGAGYLPYSIKVKESQLLVVSALGGGLLIGCALGIVIPEGFHAFAEVRRRRAGSTPPKNLKHGQKLQFTVTGTSFSPHPSPAAQIGGDDGHAHGHDDHHDHDHGHEDAPPSGLTGLALIGGFLLMMFLDQAQASAAGGHAHCGHAHHAHAHAADGEDRDAHGHGTIELTDAAAAAAVADPPLPGPPPSSGTPGKGGALPDASAADRAVIGLLVHCVSDGLALGAAFLSGNATVSYGVGLALVLHKAPMAFGLTAYLQSCKWPWARAQRTLVTFAATAPASAVATYTLLRAVPAFTTPLAVSLAILFSGGTFLHAATMHILPEVVGEGGRFSVQQLAAVAAGCVVPILFSWGHHH